MSRVPLPYTPKKSWIYSVTLRTSVKWKMPQLSQLQEILRAET